MPSVREELVAVARDLAGHLEWLRESGVREVAAPPRPAAPATKAAPQAPSAPGASLRAVVRAAVAEAARGSGSASALASVSRPAASAPPPAPETSRNLLPKNAIAVSLAAEAKRPGASASAAPALAPAPTSLGQARPLDVIRADIGDCRRCKLGPGRKKLVFGVGNPKAELVFVGEGPGEEEDNQGVPFVGRAGQLLTKMIEAMGFDRSDVYICNVVKCRPPNNRNPEPDEIEACEPFLREQLSSLSPKVIVALGKFAAQTLLRESTAISRLRGNWREYCGVPLMPTFHPAYLLRSPEEKKKAWLDLQQVMMRFGKTPAAAKKGD